MVLFSGAVSGWTAQFTPDLLRGSVSGWTNVANLGGGALGSLAVMSLIPHLAVYWLGLGLGGCILLGTVPTAFFPPPRKSSFSFRQIFTDALKATWHASKTKECLTGFALFLAPASAVAAINLFSGMGKDFHANEHTVIWITGAGCAISTSLGALTGGYAANRISRGYLYLCAGLTASLFALALAFLPHTATTFIFGVFDLQRHRRGCVCGIQRAWLPVSGTEEPGGQHATGTVFGGKQRGHRVHDMVRRAGLQAFWCARIVVDRWPRGFNLSNPAGAVVGKATQEKAAGCCRATRYGGCRVRVG